MEDWIFVDEDEQVVDEASNMADDKEATEAAKRLSAKYHKQISAYRLVVTVKPIANVAASLYFPKGIR